MLNKSTTFGSTVLKFGNGFLLLEPVLGNGSPSTTGLLSGKTGRFLEAVIIHFFLLITITLFGKVN